MLTMSAGSLGSDVSKVERIFLKGIELEALDLVVRCQERIFRRERWHRRGGNIISCLLLAPNPGSSCSLESLTRNPADHASASV